MFRIGRRAEVLGYGEIPGDERDAGLMRPFEAKVTGEGDVLQVEFICPLNRAETRALGLGPGDRVGIVLVREGDQTGIKVRLEIRSGNSSDTVDS